MNIAVVRPNAFSAALFVGAEQEIDVLWRDRCALVREEHQMVARIDAATERLPWWAQSGPEALDHEGRHVGNEVGWPARIDVNPPEHPHALRLIRPSLRTLRRERERSLSLFGRSAGQRRVILETHRQAVRSFIKRVREQRSEEDALGIRSMRADLEALIDQRFSVEDTIRRIDEQTPSAVSRAASCLLALECSVYVTATPAEATPNERWSIRTLAVLAPMLVGAIAEHVRELVENDDKRFKEMGFLTGAVSSTEPSDQSLPLAS